jgi:uncharacterized membrane protein
MYWDEKELDARNKDPGNWKLGLFYYNKGDERLIVPKRKPDHGATVNFANPWSLLVFFPLVLFIIIAVILVIVT